MRCSLIPRDDASPRRPRHNRGVTRRVFLGTLLATFVVLVAIGVAGMLDPPVESRAAVDVPYDLDGPIAQPFEAFGLDGWLVRRLDGSVRAFSAASPHRQCRVIFLPPGDPRYERTRPEIPDERGIFFDICFNSRWTSDGVRTFGPAPRGLDEFQVKGIREGYALLDLSRVIVGACVEGWDTVCSQSGDQEYQTPRPVVNPGNP